MAENYDVQGIIDDLKQKEEMDARKHDGCYELMDETVKAYASLSDLSALDYKDLNLVYLTTIGTWSHGLNMKKKNVTESHLKPDDKEYLMMLWDDVWEKAGRGEYDNCEPSAKERRSIGLFGSGFFSFQRGNLGLTSEQTQNFIRMLIDIRSMTDDNKMFDRAETVLTTPFPGMRAAAASMILHCLKPYSFPILNRYHNIFEVIGIQLTRTTALETYIDNCRTIKIFRDKNFTCKNYRIFDSEARDIERFIIGESTLQTFEDEAKGADNMMTFGRNTILYGPPGTGKTYNAVIYAVAICEGKAIEDVKQKPYGDVLARYNDLKQAGRIEFTTFHQSYGYEEFIEGIKPRLNEDRDTLGYTIEGGIFKAFCDKARKISVQTVTGERETKPYVFIIDEINRGNISKIFGELITLIEDSKRTGAAEAMEAKLPYSGELFSIPQNVYILGTMNTADRSIALIDTALRRRFEFVEMMPDSRVLENLKAGRVVAGDEELNVARMLDVINERIGYLFDREHTIGHAFFTKLADDPSIDTLAGIFEKNVIPLLQEYFYEDYEKIQLVLGDNAKEDEFKFILDRPVKVKDVFNGTPDVDLPERRYEIQHSAFKKLKSYKLIGGNL